MGIKFQSLNEDDFALHSVDKDFDINKIIPVNRLENSEGVKHRQQHNVTSAALEKLVAENLQKESLEALS
jgi:hypothetical protein